MTIPERIKILEQEIDALDHRARLAGKEQSWAHNLAAQKRLELNDLRQSNRPASEVVKR